MKISIITAFSKPTRAIGKDGHLVWKLPKDMARFKSLTMGHFCVVGYNTFSTLPILPGIKLIVLSKKHKINTAGIFLASSVEMAIDIAKTQGEDELFCIGGEQIYKIFLPIADVLYITEVLEKHEGDAFFPRFCEQDYLLLSEEISLELVFKTYKKIS